MRPFLRFRVLLSLEGVRKYYGVQHRLIDQRLSALETGRKMPETEADADNGNGDPESKSVAASALQPRQFKGPTQAEVLDAEESFDMVTTHDRWAVPSDGEERAQTYGETDVPRREQRSKRKRARSQRVGPDTAEAD